jgi:alpha-beta hydrolase superfamily lysophospholipase
LTVRRLIALVVLTLALAGCGRREAATEDLFDTRTPPALGPRFYMPEGWAWGWIEPPKAERVRYGVVSPPGRPRGHLVLMAGADESAEVYFETARDLVAQGWTIWVVDPAGTPVAGATALRHLIDNVARPKADERLVVAATDASALSALLAAEDNPRRIDGLALWAPRLHEPLAALAAERIRSGLGGMPADGERAWTRPDYDISTRATLPEAWRTANPDLRPRKRPWRWFDAQARAIAAGTRSDRLERLDVPVLVLDTAESPARELCDALPRCRFLALEPGRRPPHLSPDPQRNPWLQGLAAFAAEPDAGEASPAVTDLFKPGPAR